MARPRPVGDIVRGITLSAIDTCPDLRKRAERIEIALRCGILTEGEAAEKRAIVEALAA